MRLRPLHHLITFLLGNCIAAAAGCQNAPPHPAATLKPARCVQVGTASAASVWDTKDAFARGGIPVYTDGKDYPQPYRILVPPEYRDRAVTLLHDLEKRPFPYLVTRD